MIGAIRKHDPDNLVIGGSPEWDQRIDLVATDPIKGQTNVIYLVHFYAGTHGEWLRIRTQSALDAGVPVFVTESSGSSTTPCPTRQAKRSLSCNSRPRALAGGAKLSSPSQDNNCAVFCAPTAGSGQLRSLKLGDATRRDAMRTMPGIGSSSGTANTRGRAGSGQADRPLERLILVQRLLDCIAVGLRD